MPPEESHTPTRLFHLLEEGLLVLLMGIMIVLAFAQIILRNFLSISILWADPMIRHLVLWTSLLGATIATRKDKHIKIDALIRFISPRQQTLLNGLSGLFSTLVCALLTWVSVQFVGDEKTFETRTFGDIPTWKLQIIFPLSFGLMALRFFYQAVHNLLAFIRGYSH
jgi:TRAP-type C4-dicarboxylate transport system permease small subunit